MVRLTVLVFCVLAVSLVACQADKKKLEEDDGNYDIEDYEDYDSGEDEETDVESDDDKKVDGGSRRPPADSKPGSSRPESSRPESSRNDFSGPESSRPDSSRPGSSRPRPSGHRPSRPRGKKPKMPMTHIMMPTGKSYNINDAAYVRHECGTPAKLVKLNPHGRMGKREYNIVSHEVQNTRRDIGDASRELKIVKIEKVLNNCLWRKYKNYQDKIKSEVGYTQERMLFNEGSDYENIIDTGFKAAHTVEDIFGRALYFAKDSSTAHWHGIPNYSRCADCERVMLLCRVTLGKTLKQSSDKSLPGPPKEYHSVRGLPAEGGLSYEEFAVYNSAQVYPEYVITYKTMPLRDGSSRGDGHRSSNRRERPSRH